MLSLLLACQGFDQTLVLPLAWYATTPMWCHGPLARYVKLRVTHAPGMPGTFSPPPRVSDPDMHHGTCVMHVPWCMPWLLNSGFLGSRWRGKRSRHSWRMRNPQFFVSGKRPIVVWMICQINSFTFVFSQSIWAAWMYTRHPNVTYNSTEIRYFWKCCKLKMRRFGLS